MKTSRCRYPRRAFSLIELIVVIVILTVASSMFLQAFFSGHSTAPTNTTNQLVLQMAARKASDSLIGEVRKGTDVVRPFLGETTPYLVYKDVKNRVCFVFTEKDDARTAEMKRDLYKLVHYTTDYSGVFKPENMKVLGDLVQRVSFSLRTPTSVQVVVTVANAKQESQLITQVSTMNLGDIDG